MTHICKHCQTPVTKTGRHIKGTTKPKCRHTPINTPVEKPSLKARITNANKKSRGRGIQLDKKPRKNPV